MLLARKAMTKPSNLPSSFPLCHNWIYLCKVFCKGKVSQRDFTAYVLNTSHTRISRSKKILAQMCQHFLFGVRLLELNLYMWCHFFLSKIKLKKWTIFWSLKNRGSSYSLHDSRFHSVKTLNTLVIMKSP